MRKNCIDRILLVGCIAATLCCISACTMQSEVQITATSSDSVSQEGTTPEPTSLPQSTITIDYGRIDFTPAERDAFFAELATMDVLTDSEQLAPSEAVLVYATATEAAVLIPFVDTENGERAWLEIALFKQGDTWQTASVQSEDDVDTVYFCDADQDAINQLWIDIVRNGQDPYMQYRQYIGDADGDGTDEIFTLVTSGSNTAEPSPCVLWCYHDRTYEKIGEVTVCDLGADAKSQGEDAPHWMTVGTRKLFTLSESTGLSTWANVYTVQDGEVIAFEGIGQSITQGDESLGENVGDFTIVVGAYDMSYMPNATDDGLLYTGHSYKPYYLYWDEENCMFHEYGAVEISIESLAQLGVQGDIAAIIALIQRVSQQDIDTLCIDAVYHFANDKYKINYHFGDDQVGDCYYLAYRLIDGALADETPGEHSGLYLPAVYPAVAVYPSVSEDETSAQSQTIQNKATLLEETSYASLNLDGIGTADDQACVSIYRWDENGRADIIVITVQLGTGEQTAYTVPSAEYSYEWGASLMTGALFSTEKDVVVLEIPVPQSNYGAADVYVLEVFGASPSEAPGIYERLNTQDGTMCLPSGIKTEIAQLGMVGSFTDGTQVVSLPESDLQGLQLYTTGTTADWRDTAQTIYWTKNGWAIIEQ